MDDVYDALFIDADDAVAGWGIRVWKYRLRGTRNFSVSR